jgi:exodeoxyribonuclease VII small subunit
MAKKKPSYEEAVKRIEEIADLLENEEISLEKLIGIYKEGMELTLFCRQKLDGAKADVMALKKQFDGSFAESKFDSNKEVLE